MADAVYGNALVAAAAHAVKSREAALFFRVQKGNGAELFGALFICRDDVSVIVPVVHEHILIVSEHHVRCPVPVISKGVRKSECKTQHEFTEYDAEDEHRVIRHVLEQHS